MKNKQGYFSLPVRQGIPGYTAKYSLLLRKSSIHSFMKEGQTDEKKPYPDQLPALCVAAMLIGIVNA